MITSPFADTEAPPSDAAAEPSTPPVRRWTTPYEVLTAVLPGVGSARLPSVATVRAYHKVREYVPWEAAVLDWPARMHGWLAIAWLFCCTCAAWAGAGAYRRRFRTLWQVGLPGLAQAQLPPLDELRGLPRWWVAAWSAIGWLGLKLWRLPIFLLYVVTAVLPFVF